MSCHFEEDLTAFVDRELPPARMTEVQAHLPGCASCQTTHALLSRTVAQLAAMPAFEPSAALRRAVMNRLDQPSLADRLGAWARPSVWIPAFGAAALMVTAVVLSHHPRGPGPSIDVADAEQLELASNLDVAESLELAGVQSPEDLDAIEHLDELEVKP